MNGRAEVHMHVPLESGQTFHDLLGVLALTLDVFAGSGAGFQFLSLVGIAWVVLIGDGNRHDVQPAHGLAKIQPALLTAHVEHLDDGRIGEIKAVLRPAFPLGNPDTVIGINAVVDEAGERYVGIAHLPRAGHATTYHKALVQPHHFGEHPVCQQIVAYGNSGGMEAVLEQQVVHHHGVKHDVPVV